MNCCATHGAEMTCNQGRNCPARANRLHTANSDGSDPHASHITLGRAALWLAVALAGASMAAWIGLAAGYWSAA